MLHRPRRNRKSAQVRALVQETRLHPSDLVYPQFVIEGIGIREPIKSMPGSDRVSVDHLLKECERIQKLGIPATALFPVVSKDLKDFQGSEALNPNALLQRAIRAIKKEFPDLCVISDVALDLYATHGHDGLVNNEGEIVNDETVDVLTKMAIVHAEAGVDMVAPSDMMDGRVRGIREGLDQAGFQNVSILSYAAKYASAFYGPYREAHASFPAAGDKKSYQLNPANSRVALLEAELDEAEGADILMVKPALHYLDIIAKLKETSHLPISAFHITGEYAQIMAGVEKGWLDKEAAFWEATIAIKRAGADMIFTYAAPLIAEMITSGAHD